MLSPALHRLLWKETRTLTPLAGLLLATAVLIQFAGPFVYLVTTGGSLQHPFVVAFALTACFAMTATAVLFSGEAEEGTLAFLRQLPIRPRDLLQAKLGMATLSTLAFAGLAILSASFTRTTFGAWFGSGAVPGFEFYRNAMFGGLVWGVLFSVTGHGVLQTLLSTIAAELLTIALIGGLIDDARQDLRNGVYFTLLGGVALLDGWLAWQWALGRAPVLAPPTRQTRRLASLTGRFWLGVLIRIVDWCSPRGRLIGVLAWRELRTAAPFVIAAAGASSLIVRISQDGGLLGLLLILAPLACGLMTAYSDQRWRTASFLGDRGAPPATTWCIKQGVWFGGAILVTGAMLLTWFAGSHSSTSSQTGAGALLHQIELARLPDHPSDTDRLQAARIVALAGSLFCSLYALGQISAFWFRQPIVSTLIAVLLAIPLGLWHGLCIEAAVPAWIAAWPLAALWMLATLALMNDWLSAAASRRVLLARMALLVAPAMAAFGGFVIARKNSIPVPALTFDLAKAQRSLTEIDRGSTDSLFSILSQIRRLERVPRSGEIMPTAAEDVQMANDLHEFLAHRSTGAGLQSTILDVTDWWYYRATTPIGRRLRAAGRSDVEFRFYLDLLKLTRLKQDVCLDPQDYSKLLAERSTICRWIADWANDVGQSEEALREALPLLRAEFAHALTVRPTIHRWTAAAEMAIDHRGPLVERGYRYEVTGGERFAERLFALFGERARMRNLVLSIGVAADRLQDYRPVGASWRNYWQLEHDYFSQTSIQPWLESSPPLYERDRIGRDARSLPRILFEERDAITAQNAAQLIVALQAHRRQHGSFPETLLALLGETLPDLPEGFKGVDQFEPRGSPLPTLIDSNEVLPAGRPLLWSSSGTTGGWRQVPVEGREFPGVRVHETMRLEDINELLDALPALEADPISGPHKVAFVDLDTWQTRWAVPEYDRDQRKQK